MNKTFSYYKNDFPIPALKRISRILLYSLVTTLTFEGLLRKLVPTGVGIVIFFLKDFLCITGFFFVYKQSSFPLIYIIKQKWVWVAVALIPLLIYAFCLDPALSLFAAKQYLLYTVVVLLVQFCFFDKDFIKIKKFLFYFSLLLLITTAVAMIENALPATSWINLSVGGDSLENFSAGGYLRVSSTFSFTGQYCWFLNIAFPITVAFVSVSSVTSKKIGIWQLFYWSILVIAYVIGIFITGGRTAVLGAAAILGIGFLCLILKRPLWVVSSGLIMIVAVFLLLGVLREYKPEYFAAYEQRSTGSETQTHEEEIQDRVGSSFTDWTIWFWKEDFANIIMGNGLAVMSNGSEQISSFAKNVKRNGFWTETDTATIFWEGGIYLAFIWYLFRFFIIITCFRVYWSIKDKSLNFAAAFLFSYIFVTGTIGTLSIQPPLSIWWWLAVGVLLSLKYNEESLSKKQNKVYIKINTINKNTI